MKAKFIKFEELAELIQSNQGNKIILINREVASLFSQNVLLNELEDTKQAVIVEETKSNINIIKK